MIMRLRDVLTAGTERYIITVQVIARPLIISETPPARTPPTHRGIHLCVHVYIILYES